MKSLGYIRKIDELGRIVIPKEVRRKFDINNANDTVEFFADGDMLILKKYLPSCLFCGSEDNTVELSRRRVCADCIKKLSEMVESE